MGPDLHRLAARVAWWDTPAHTVSRLDDFLARVMTLGTWDDVNAIEAFYGASRLRQALQSASRRRGSPADATPDVSTFEPRLDILPPAQRRLWNEFRGAI